MHRGSLVATGVTFVAFLALFGFLRGTAMGRAVRSVIEDEEGARLVGIDPRKMLRLILVLSGVLAAIVGVTRSMSPGPVNVTAGFSITVFALIVTVVGGLGSVTGALLAGLILGVINSIAASYIGTVLSLIILLVAAALTIVLRPAGLLGVRE
jgi:branched-chain amino acid transport system permease protein